MKEKNIIKKYITNNELKIEEIMQDFTPYIYMIIKNKNYNLSDEDIEEITSDVFLALWKNKNRLDINKDMSSYLAGITKNIVSKKIRNIKNNDDINNYENTLYNNENVEIEIERDEKSNLIIEEINNMKKEDRIIFMSYYYYSKGMKEIANELNISEGKVKSRLFRIRKKLKTSLEKRGYNGNG